MTPAAARALVTARIAALTPDVGYAQGTAAWVEALVPLIPEFEPEPKAHLSFFVDDRQQSLKRTRANSGEQLLVNTPARIRFLFRLRPNSRKDDWDAASDAARAVWRQLLSESGSWNGDLNVFPPDGVFCERSVIGDAAFCLVTLTLQLEHFTEAV